MRIGIVRTDLGRGVYLADVESHVQRQFDVQRPGQARKLRRPTDSEFLSVLQSYPAPVVRIGSETSVSVNTLGNNTIRIRSSANSVFSSINVSSGSSVLKTTIRDDLNTGFTLAGLGLVASILAPNRLRIQTTFGGPSSYIEIDSVAHGSTLNSIVGFSTSGTSSSGSSFNSLLTALKSRIYSGSTFNVSQSNIISTSISFSLLSTNAQANFASAIADLVAPKFVETGLVLLSFSKGILSKLISTTFRPDGARVGLPIGSAIYATADDGSTPFTYP